MSSFFFLNSSCPIDAAHILIDSWPPPRVWLSDIPGAKLFNQAEPLPEVINCQYLLNWAWDLGNISHPHAGICLECRIFSPKLDIYIMPPSSKAQGHCRREGGKPVRDGRVGCLPGNNVFQKQQGTYEYTTVLTECKRSQDLIQFFTTHNLTQKPTFFKLKNL